MKWTIVLLILIASMFKLHSQTNWYGHGVGLSHLEFVDKEVKFRTYDNSREKVYTYANMQSGKILAYNELKDEYEYEPLIRIEFLNTEKDSLKLEVGSFVYKFYKDPKHINKRPFNLQSFSFELLDHLKGTLQKIELSSQGVLRESDGSNRTLFEVKLQKDETKEFYIELNKLDITNIHLLNRSYNNCNNTEYCLTFVNGNKQRFTYTSIQLIRTLEPIVEIVTKLLAKQKGKSH